MADIDKPNFEAFIAAAKQGAQPAQIVGWAEKMEAWATKALREISDAETSLGEVREELSEALAEGEQNAKHVAALAQLIRDAKRKLSSGADMLQYLNDNELWGPDETQSTIDFHVMPGAR